MRIVITGSSGFVGQNLKLFLEKQGHEIIPLHYYELSAGKLLPVEKIDGSDAIINLAGASIAGRWTRKRKRLIYTSRIHTTRKIVETICKCNKRPEILINASAIGIYDDIHVHDEQSRFISYDFLGKVVRNWEYSAAAALEYGVKVSFLRMGVILGKNGGMFKKILPVFRCCLGGVIGTPGTPFCFIHIGDLISIISKILCRELPSGVYNAVAPQIVTNLEFVRCLSEILAKPAFFSVPPFVLRAVFKEGAVLFCKGQSVVPARLEECGYKFIYPEIRAALKSLC